MQAANMRLCLQHLNLLGSFYESAKLAFRFQYLLTKQLTVDVGIFEMSQYNKETGRKRK